MGTAPRRVNYWFSERRRSVSTLVARCRSVAPHLFVVPVSTTDRAGSAK